MSRKRHEFQYDEGHVEEMDPLAVTALSMVSALGVGLRCVREHLADAEGGLRPCDFPGAKLDTFIGRVEGLEEAEITGTLARFDSRNNRLAQMALKSDEFGLRVSEARQRYSPERIAVYVGTSTSGLLSLEEAYRERDPESGNLPEGFNYKDTFNNFSVTDYVRRLLGLEGPASTISTACSSSAKVFASASRMIDAGVCDAVVVGGVDTLCLTTLYGFNSLGLLSPGPCRPFDAGRKGLSIGEGAGFALLERMEAARERALVGFLGYGESSDAFHMASPHPEGLGAKLAISHAVKMAGARLEGLDYVNLHGTGTLSNDESEARAVASSLGNEVPCSSTKGWTGHCLGAAGIIEAIISILCIQEDLVPMTLNTKRLDPACSINIVLATRRQKVMRVLSNSFGFGGSNCSLIFGSLS